MALELPDDNDYILITARDISQIQNIPLPNTSSSDTQHGFDVGDGNEYLSQLLARDALTGLYSPKAFYEKAEVLVQENPETLYEMLYIDIEHFKVFNERYGRDIGDTILKALASELLTLKNDYAGIAGYIGGDDFVIILPEGAIEANEISNRLSEAVKKPEYDIVCLPVIGITSVSDLSVPMPTYGDHAMTAMNAAKGIYSTRIANYEDTMTRQLEEEPKTMAEIEQALANKEFINHYQPKCNLKTGQIVGLEALVRWQHPERGLVFPGGFIPFLERTGLIANLDIQVWEEACRQTREWLDRGVPALPISVNVSRADLQLVDVVNLLESLVDKYDIDKSFLELEITESAFVEDDNILDTVIELSNHGFTLLMDDFGSGYSSLNMLKDIPVDVLKIDMRFLDLSDNALFRGESILDAVVTMAHHLGLSVIAEGAETREQVNFLKNINSDFVQGYYFYKPLSVVDLEAVLSQKNIVDYQGANRKHIELLDPLDLVQNYITNKTILDAILGGIAIYNICDGKLELIEANNQYFQLVGDNPPAGVEDRRSFFERAPKEVVEETSDLLTRSEQHPVLGAVDEFCQRRADGRYIWVRVQAFFLMKDGDRKIFLGKLTDISAQKSYNDSLKASDNAIAAFVRNLPGAIIGAKDEENYPILFANDEVAFILGYVSPAEFINETDGELEALIHPDDRAKFKNYLINEQQDRNVELLKIRLIRKSETYTSVYVQCKIVERQGAQPLITLSFIDVNEIDNSDPLDCA